MLAELGVRNLGVIDDLRVVLGPGLTAVTGETGAGKTLIIEAIQLLLGSRTDQALVRKGEKEAWVEGRFVTDGNDEMETVLSRAVPCSGRSRAYVDGSMVSAAGLAARGETLVELSGQHSHHEILTTRTRRHILDAYGGVSTALVTSIRRELAEIEREMSAMGGDERSRAREMDLLRFQLSELDAAQLDDPEEEAALLQEQERLRHAAESKQTAALVYQMIAGESGAADRVGSAVSATRDRPALTHLWERLRAVEADVADLAADARQAAEELEENPQRLDEVTGRLALLGTLKAKYGSTIAEMLEFGMQTSRRLAELQSYEATHARLDAERISALAELAKAERGVGEARRRAAPAFGTAVQERLRTLAMPKATFQICCGPDAMASESEWLLGANPGEEPLPLQRVASGGELARTMLAVRLATGRGNELDKKTLVFDEVDAGIGGEAALAVGEALAELAAGNQVLVVTHLAQVAAFADLHLAVEKGESGSRTVVRAGAVAGEERVREVSRMLSGRPDSASGRRHAEELLAASAGHPR